jgi:hypothetical protein
VSIRIGCVGHPAKNEEEVIRFAVGFSGGIRDDEDAPFF